MIVGVLRTELRLSGTQSLKDKRRIIRSLLDRIRREYRVAAAEVEFQDHVRRAALGFACVSDERRHADQVLTRVLSVIEREAEASVVDHSIELL